MKCQRLLSGKNKKNFINLPSADVAQIVDINSHIEWQTVQIQISWLLNDLDLHCLQRQGIFGFNFHSPGHLNLYVHLLNHMHK